MPDSKSIVRILHLEDNPRDAELIRDRLAADDLVCDIVLVDARERFEKALSSSPFDTILCDFNLPDYDGVTALLRARELQPDTPVIVVSGSFLSEVEAVESLKRGATDYLFKDRLERLPVAVRNALREADELRKRKRAEQALAESERFARASLDALTAHIAVLDDTGRILATNRAWREFAERHGQAPGRAGEGADYIGVCQRAGAQGAAAAELIQSVITGRRKEAAFEYPCHSPAEERWFVCRITRFPSDGPVRVVVAHEDITERKKAEEHLLRAQRVESLGMLAAGIAHDFNNALAPLAMGCSLLRPDIADPGALRIVSLMENNTQRCVDLVRQLLGFARGAGDETRLLQTRHVLRDLVELAKSTFNKSIVIVSHLPADLWPVRANVTQLHQVILNLCVNARDAMPQGGTLTLRASNRAFDAAAAAGVPGARPGEFLAIEVRDTGGGIPPAVLARIWEPFFTTKPVGQGTGLGLSTVRGIVQSHRGFIAVDTQAGKGTAFTVYLPAEHGPAAGGTAAPMEQLPRGNGEFVLIVDDEEAVREFTAQILTNHGYHALTACDGADAIAVFARHLGKVDLLLVDLQMPMLNGGALAAVLRRMQPSLRVVAMSATLGQSVPGEREFIKSATAFLPKPFKTETLLPFVHRVLHEEPAAPGGSPSPAAQSQPHGSP